MKSLTLNIDQKLVFIYDGNGNWKCENSMTMTDRAVLFMVRNAEVAISFDPPLDWNMLDCPRLQRAMILTRAGYTLNVECPNYSYLLQLPKRQAITFNGTAKTDMVVGIEEPFQFKLHETNCPPCFGNVRAEIQPGALKFIESVTDDDRARAELSRAARILAAADGAGLVAGVGCAVEALQLFRDGRHFVR